jgi:hypothetical protein
MHRGSTLCYVRFCGITNCQQGIPKVRLPLMPRERARERCHFSQHNLAREAHPSRLFRLLSLQFSVLRSLVFLPRSIHSNHVRRGCIHMTYGDVRLWAGQSFSITNLVLQAIRLCRGKSQDIRTQIVENLILKNVNNGSWGRPFHRDIGRQSNSSALLTVVFMHRSTNYFPIKEM